MSEADPETRLLKGHIVSRVDAEPKSDAPELDIHKVLKGTFEHGVGFFLKERSNEEGALDELRIFVDAYRQAHDKLLERLIELAEQADERGEITHHYDELEIKTLKKMLERRRETDNY